MQLNYMKLSDIQPFFTYKHDNFLWFVEDRKLEERGSLLCSDRKFSRTVTCSNVENKIYPTNCVI